MSKLTYLAACARQSPEHQVLTFAATAEEVLRFARIERVGRDSQGVLSGFQRPQIASHIREIQDYLEKPDAVLPNPIVVAFTDRVTVEHLDGGIAQLVIDAEAGPVGLVVDGQQRLSALSQTRRLDFQVFVSALVCRDEEELRRQFVLINNTRPLPKSLIYELLPTVHGLPDRMEGRSVAAELTARLNFDQSSSLRGQIHQHTNPAGIIRDTAIQRVLMNSLSDGAMRELIQEPGGERKCLQLVSNYFSAVQRTFPEDWMGHKPATSRLVHGAGIQAMGHVMEVLVLLDGSRKTEEFMVGLSALRGRTAWRSGSWDFGGGDVRHWKAIQNLNRDVISLAHHLIGIVRAGIRARRSGAQAAPLLEVALTGTDS
jgi:DGQHR domain-containing protein